MRFSYFGTTAVVALQIYKKIAPEVCVVASNTGFPLSTQLAVKSCIYALIIFKLGESATQICMCCHFSYLLHNTILLL